MVMADWSGWDLAIILAAAYVCSIWLVRMMSARRTEILAELQEEVEHERLKKLEAERRERKKRRMDERARAAGARKSA